MRLRVVLCLVLLALVLPSRAHAWTETYCWAPVAGATSYKLDTSLDNGVTFVTQATLVTPVSAPQACGPGSVGLVYTGAATTLVLVRIQACSASVCAARSQDYLAHLESAPPTMCLQPVTNVTVQ